MILKVCCGIFRWISDGIIIGIDEVNELGFKSWSYIGSQVKILIVH